MTYEVEVREVAPELTACIKLSCAMAELPQAMPVAFDQVSRVLAEQGVQPTGGAVALYTAWTEDTVEAEVGFTVATEVAQTGNVKQGRLPGGRVLATVHVGTYEGLEAAYEAIQEHAGKNGLSLAGMMWECYLTDPAVEPDLSRHVTEVYWPLQGMG